MFQRRHRAEYLIAALIVLVPMLLIDPFSWPVQGDRAFLVYMSQVVARGEPLYAATPFGYTPLASLLGGTWIWLIGQVSELPSYLSVRFLGLICYPLTGAAVYRLIRTITPNRHLALIGVILFAGFGMPMMIGCINAEPKILVVLFATLGTTSVLRRQWLLAGIFAGLCAISWQPAGLYGLAMLLTALTTAGQRRWQAAGRLLIGGILGTSILFIYLAATDTWQPAWNQLVLKHLSNEASRLGESPFNWVGEITRGFLPEVLHFLLAGAGFILALIAPRAIMIKQRPGRVLLGSALVLWLLFFSLEFQSHVDFIVILPLLTVWSVVTIDRLMDRFRLPHWVWIAGIALYSLGDAPWMRPGITLQEQQEWVASIMEAYPDRALVASRASQVHVLLERQMPLKYIRYHAAEEVVVEMEGGCEVLEEQLTGLPDWLLVVRRTRPSHLHPCATELFDAMCAAEPVLTFREPASMIPIPRLVSWYAVYDVYRCGPDETLGSGYQ